MGDERTGSHCRRGAKCVVGVWLEKEKERREGDEERALDWLWKMR
jgi:hypothetical protein